MPDAWFDTGTALVRDALDAGGTVLTHCHMGINRGPSMGFAAMLTLGWDPVDALDAIRTVRPIAYVAYAEDAVDWWLRQTGANAVRRRSTLAELARWRLLNHVGPAAVTRSVRTPSGA